MAQYLRPALRRMRLIHGLKCHRAEAEMGVSRSFAQSRVQLTQKCHTLCDLHGPR